MVVGEEWGVRSTGVSRTPGREMGSHFKNVMKEYIQGPRVYN